MNIKIKWEARVIATEEVEHLVDFANEALAGLVLAELVPESSWVEKAEFNFSRRAEVTIRWDTSQVLGDADKKAAS